MKVKAMLATEWVPEKPTLAEEIEHQERDKEWMECCLPVQPDDDAEDNLVRSKQVGTVTDLKL